MLAAIKFRPIERATLELLLTAHKAEGADPVAAYGRLMSSAMVAGAIIGLTPQQIAQQAEAFAEQAQRAIVERGDIFGSFREEPH